MLQNNKRKNLYTELHSGDKERRLAIQVEEENYKQKNRYRLETEQLDFKDKR